MDLFGVQEKSNKKIQDLPLAVRIRPTALDEFVGQRHILSPGKLLSRAIQADKISSLILYGPPGSGKTTLAYIIANKTESFFKHINAVTSNVQELRDIINKAKQNKIINNKKTILFIDEIHRFNKLQQDALIPYVEEENPILIGTTTHNPFFSLVPPLISRSIVFELKSLTSQDVLILLQRALKDKQRGFGKINIKAEREALRFLAEVSNGDARKALNALEIGILTTQSMEGGIINFDLKVAQESIQKKAIIYDKDEDAHYDTISSFIKSMRGSDPDAALYWLAKMLYAGEDPKFIARRIVICAAEDVGNADPQALVIANAALQVTEFVGLPECRIPLAQVTCYIACAPKSNASYIAIEKAMKDVEENKTLEVPNHLKNSHYKAAEKLGRGIGYKYPHNFKEHFVKQDYIPSSKKYYQPQDSGYEKKIKEFLQKLSKWTD